MVLHIESTEGHWALWQARDVMKATLHRLLATAGKGRAGMLSAVCIQTPVDIRLEVVKVNLKFVSPHLIWLNFCRTKLRA